MKRLVNALAWAPWLPPAAALTYLAPRVLAAVDPSALLFAAVTGAVAGLAVGLAFVAADRLERRG